MPSLLLLQLREDTLSSTEVLRFSSLSNKSLIAVVCSAAMVVGLTALSITFKVMEQCRKFPTLTQLMKALDANMIQAKLLPELARL